MIHIARRLFIRNSGATLRIKYRFGAGGEKALSKDHHQHSVQQHDSDEDHHDDHHHHHAPYDWRDDFSKNPDYQEDVLHRGVPHPKTYHYPHDAPATPWVFSHPQNYDQKNLRSNLVTVSHIGPIVNTMRAPQTDLAADVAHECDYESEDLDFQPEDFHTQHFRKKGHMWMWVTVGLMPLIFWSAEFFLQKYPDEYHWRYQRPPPLNYPDPDDTPDHDTYALFHSPEFKMLYEAGLLVKPFFEIKNGKKVFTKESGVNQPMEEI